MEGFPHLDEETKKYATLPPERRIEYLYRPRTIIYPRLKNLVALMDRHLEYPKRPRMPNLLVVGESNIGKTTAVRKFVDTHPQITFEDETGMSRVRMPVLYMVAPHTSDEKSFYIAILEQFWTSFRPNDTLAKLRHQAFYLMRECDVGMIVIDEMHNLLETTPVRQRTMMNLIKNLGNELMVPIVGVGTETALQVLGTDPQHASRFEVARLPAWKLDREFLGLLKGFEKILPLQKPSGLYSREKAKLLYSISDGNLGNLHKLLMQCAEEAIRTGEEEISTEIIGKFRWVRPTQKGRPVEIPL